MTYNEFKKAYNKKYIDYDGQFGSQCWDLAQYYFIKVLGLPSSILGGCGLVSNMLYEPKRSTLNKYFVEIGKEQALQGDVAIWEYGHIAIVDSNTKGKLKYFSQNPNPCQVMSIDVAGVHIFRKRGNEYFVSGIDYKLQYDVNLRTSPYVKKDNIPKVKNIDTYTKQFLTSKKPNDNAVMKKGTIVNPAKISYTDKRIWISYGNCWLCGLDKDGTYLIRRA